MRLRRLQVERLPGIERRIDLDDLIPGINVIVGPNASGKSSLVRALLALLYPQQNPGQLRLAAELVLSSGEERRADRLGDETVWTSAGAVTSAPRLVPWEASGAYFLRLEDLVLEPAVARGARGKPALPSTGPTDLDRAVAKAIARELTGGIDLEAVAKGFGKLDNKGNVAAGELRDRLQELSRLRAAQAEIQRREERLPELERALEDARRVADSAEQVREALALAAELRTSARLEDEIAALGPGLERLDERAAARLEAALAAEAAAARRVSQAREETVGLASELESLALPSLAPSAAAAREYTEAARELRDLTAELADIDSHGAQAHAELRAALRQVGVESSVEQGVHKGADLSLVALARVEASVERRLVTTTRAQRLEDELAAVPNEDPARVEGRGGSEADLAEAERALSMWLDAGASRWRLSWPARWAWLVGGLLTGAALFASSRLSSLVEAWPAWVAPLAGGAAAAAVLALLTGPWSPARRRAARAAFTSSGLIAPERWSEAAVTARLSQIAVEREARRRAHEQWLRQEARREQLSAQLERARAEERAVMDELAVLRSEIGYAPDLPDAGIAAWLQAVRCSLELRARLSGLKAKRAEIARSLDERTRAVVSHLINSAGIAPQLPSEPGPDELIAACNQVEERLRRGEELSGLLVRAERDAAEAGEQLTAAKAATLGLLIDLGLEPSDPDGSRLELQRRLRLLPVWQRLTQDLTASRARCEASRRRLADRQDLLAAAEAAARAHTAGQDGADGELLAALSTAHAARDEVESLSKQIFDVKRDADSAASDRMLEKATGAVAQARDRLREHRDQAIRLALGQHLIEDLAARHGGGSQPAALELARQWFARFTEGRYQLGLALEAGSARRLVAVERGAGRDVGQGAGQGTDREAGGGPGLRRELGELSTGTRTQLLLASRVAYAITEETRSGWEPLPLFLDEALTTADPARFAAVARSLLELAAGGRQVFYLSARPEDAGAWREAAAVCGQAVKVIELSASGLEQSSADALSGSTPQLGELGGARVEARS